MGRITTLFDQLRRDQKKALVVYLVAGDPTPDVTVPLMHAMVDAGVSMIELGVPFTDPEADGPVIQSAADRALAQGVSLQDTLSLAARFRKQDNETPIVLMGYLNPIENMGYEPFAKAAASAGVDGTITVNSPPEEAVVLDGFLIDHGIDPVYLLAPTTTDDRADFIFHRTRGFAYYVSLKGTTGASTIQVDSVAGNLERLKPKATVPLLVGFGIKNGDMANEIAQLCDGVVVGAAIVSLMESHKKDTTALIQAVCDLVGEMRSAMDGA